MAVKTITIDMDAYDTLSRHKKPGQSFSQVIKEHFGGRKTGRHLENAIRNLRLSEDALESMENQIESRKDSKAKAPKL
jgi:predicted CopG family antitoxin